MSTDPTRLADLVERAYDQPTEDNETPWDDWDAAYEAASDQDKRHALIILSDRLAHRVTR